MTAGEETDAKLLDNRLLADDDFSKFSTKFAVGSAELINGCHVIGGQGRGECV
jgi:hypothetical protein